MNDELKIILSNTYTADDAFMRISLARQFIEQVFFNSDGSIEDWRVLLEKFLLQFNTPPSTRAALATWGEDWFRRFAPDNINERFIELEKKIEALPYLTIIVPIDLPPAEVSRLGQWARINIQADVMVTLRVDPNSAGGCILIWKGTYLDLSLRYFFNSERSSLIDMVHQYSGIDSKSVA
jgi:F0F1-type ATP synthase delta subunit